LTIGYNEAMPRTNLQTLNLKTRGFQLFMEWQAVNGRHSIDEVAAKMGVSETTARKFIAEPEMNVRQAELGGAFVVAAFFGVPLSGDDGLVYRGPDVAADDKPSRFKGYGKRGRPAKAKPEESTE